jgi:hypothetical protein
MSQWRSCSLKVEDKLFVSETGKQLLVLDNAKSGEWIFSWHLRDLGKFGIIVDELVARPKYSSSAQVVRWAEHEIDICCGCITIANEQLEDEITNDDLVNFFENAVTVTTGLGDGEYTLTVGYDKDDKVVDLSCIFFDESEMIIGEWDDVA